MNTSRPLVGAFALLAAVTAYAQSNVQMYGIADAGIEYVNRVRTNGVGAATDKVVRLQSGNASSSRIGFRGQEALGNGLSALFVLESGFTIDDGILGQNGRLFGRQAYVGVASSLGELQLGRQPNSIYDIGLVFDPITGTRYSGVALDVGYAARADNAIKYVGNFGGLSLRVQYSFGYNGLIAGGGEVPGAFKVGKEMGAYAEYSFSNVVLGAAYDRQNGTSVATQDNTNERYVVGGSIDLKPVKLMGAYQRQKVGTSGIDTRSKLYWLGAQYAASSALMLGPVVYVLDPEGRDNRSTMYALFANYEVSKRTDFYTQIAFMNNQGLAISGMGGIVNPGDSQAGLTVGVRHRF